MIEDIKYCVQDIIIISGVEVFDCAASRIHSDPIAEAKLLLFHCSTEFDVTQLLLLWSQTVCPGSTRSVRSTPLK